MYIISFTSLSECFFPVLLFVCFCFYWNPLNSQWDNKLPKWISGPGSWWGKKETISFLYISFCAEIRFYFKEMQTIPDMLRHNETTWDISVSGLVRDARCWNIEEWIKLCLLLMIRMQQIMWACEGGRVTDVLITQVTLHPSESQQRPDTAPGLDSGGDDQITSFRLWFLTLAHRSTVQSA